MPKVILISIDANNVRAVCKLRVRADQSHFVAPNSVSLAQALFEPAAWYRAVAVDGEIAGFVMVYDEAQRPHPPPSPRLGLWRFMVDQQRQGQGIGAAALRAVLDHFRAQGRGGELELSYVPEPGSAEGFYLKQGFALTDRYEDAERVMTISLTPQTAAEPERAEQPQLPQLPAVEVHHALPGAECAVVDEGLGAFNDQAAPLHEVRPLSCFVRGADGQVVGGLAGRRWGVCAEVQQLWVDPSHRRQGIGQRLMQAFEAAAREQGCTQMYLETFNFQAPHWYELQGYHSAHAHGVYPHGIVRHLMRKDL